MGWLTALSEYDPDDARNIMVNELRIIEFVDPDGGLHTVDMSQSTGGAEMPESVYMDMIGWALAFGLAGKVAAVLAGGED